MASLLEEQADGEKEIEGELTKTIRDITKTVNLVQQAFSSLIQLSFGFAFECREIIIWLTKQFPAAYNLCTFTRYNFEGKFTNF